MAREKKVIPLSEPFDDGKGGKVTQIVLQEPPTTAFWVLGEPQTWVKSGGGAALVDNNDAIKAYAERMIVEPDPLFAMANMGVINAMTVKEAILDFFRVSLPTPSA